MAIPTQSRLHELFNYDPLTGMLTWRHRPRSEFKTEASCKSFLSRCAGKEAGHIEEQGYRVVVVDGTAYKAHKLIWLFAKGEWIKYPEFEIDHDNGVRADNRIENLFKVTHSRNQRNAGQRISNTSGIHGVNWKKRGAGGRWVARIWDGPRHVYLGQFESLHEAQIARKAAERVLGYTGTDREAGTYVEKRPTR